MARTLDIKGYIDDRPVLVYRWLLVAICFLVVMADGMDVAIMGFVTQPILQDWEVSPTTFGLGISAANYGLVLGALLAAPSSDRFGRKPMLILSALPFALLTLAATPGEMAFLHFQASMGLGAAMPNTTTLLCEYAAERRRVLMITMVFTGIKIGSALVGLSAGSLIPAHGWRSVTVLGSVVPPALVPVLVLFLPGPRRLLALRRASVALIAATRGHVTRPRFVGDEAFVSAEPPLAKEAHRRLARRRHAAQPRLGVHGNPVPARRGRPLRRRRDPPHAYAPGNGRPGRGDGLAEQAERVGSVWQSYQWA